MLPNPGQFTLNKLSTRVTIVLMLLLAVGAHMISAREEIIGIFEDPVYASISADCSVTVSWYFEEGSSDFTLVVDGRETENYSIPEPETYGETGSHTFSYKLRPGSTAYIRYYGEQSSNRVTCSGGRLSVDEIGAVAPAVPMCDDGRININLCEPIAIYPQVQENGVGTVVYLVPKGSTGGTFGFYVSPEELAALPDNPESPILIAQSEDGFASMYKLPSNEYYFIAGPDHEGKLFYYLTPNLQTTPVITTSY